MPPKALIDALEDSGFFSKFSDPARAKERVRIAKEYQDSLSKPVEGISYPSRIMNRGLIGLGQAGLAMKEMPSIVKALVPSTREQGVKELNESEKVRRSLQEASKGYGGNTLGFLTEGAAQIAPSLAQGYGTSAVGRYVATKAAKRQINKNIKDVIENEIRTKKLIDDVIDSDLEDSVKRKTIKSALENVKDGRDAISKKAQKGLLEKYSKRGSVAGGAVGAGIQSGSSSFSEVFNKHKENLGNDEAIESAFSQAVLSAMATAGVTGLFGATGIESVTKVKGFSNALKKIWKESNLEGFEESVDQAIQSAISAVTYDPDLTFGEAIVNSLMSYTFGAMGGAGAQTVGQALNTFRVKGAPPEDRTVNIEGKDTAYEYDGPEPILGASSRKASPLLPEPKSKTEGRGFTILAGEPTPVSNPKGNAQRIRRSRLEEKRSQGTERTGADLEILNQQLAPEVQAQSLSPIDSDSREIINTIVAETQWKDQSSLPDEASNLALQSLVRYSEGLGLTADEIASVSQGFNDSLSRLSTGTQGANKKRQLEGALNFFIRVANKKANGVIPETATEQEIEKRINTILKPYEEAFSNLDVPEPALQGIFNTMRVALNSAKGRMTQDELQKGFEYLLREEELNPKDYPGQTQEEAAPEEPVKEKTTQPKEPTNEEKLQEEDAGTNEEPVENDESSSEEPASEESSKDVSEKDKETVAKKRPIVKKIFDSIKKGKIKEGIEVDEQGESVREVNSEGQTESDLTELVEEQSDNLTRIPQQVSAAVTSQDPSRIKIFNLDSVPPMEENLVRPARLNMSLTRSEGPTVTVRNFKRLLFYIDGQGKARRIVASLQDQKGKPYPDEVIEQGFRDAALKEVPEDDMAEARAEIMRQINNQESQYFAPLPWAIDLNLEVFNEDGVKLTDEKGKTIFRKQYFVPHLRISAPTGQAQKDKKTKSEVAIGYFLPVKDKKNRREYVWQTLYTLKSDTLKDISTKVIDKDKQTVLDINGKEISIKAGEDRRIQFPADLASWGAVSDPKGIWQPKPIVSDRSGSRDVRLANPNRAENFRDFVLATSEGLSSESSSLGILFDLLMPMQKSEAGETYYNDNKITEGGAATLGIFDYIAKSGGESRNPFYYASNIAKAFQTAIDRAKVALQMIESGKRKPIPQAVRKIPEGFNPLKLYEPQINALIEGKDYNYEDHLKRDGDGKILPNQQSKLRPVREKGLTKEQIANENVSVEGILTALTKVSSGSVNTSSDLDALQQFLFDVGDSKDFQEKTGQRSQQKTISYDAIVSSINNDWANQIDDNPQGYDEPESVPDTLKSQQPWDRKEEYYSLLNFMENYRLQNPDTSRSVADLAREFADKAGTDVISNMGFPRISTYGLFLDIPTEIQEKVPGFYSNLQSIREEAFRMVEAYDPSSTSDHEGRQIASKLIEAYIAASKIGRMMRITPSDIQRLYRVDRGSNVEAWVYNVVYADGSKGRLSSAKRLPMFNKSADEVGRFASIGGDANIVEFTGEVEVDSPGMNQEGGSIMEKTTFYEYIAEDSIDRSRVKKVKSILNKKGAANFESVDDIREEVNRIIDGKYLQGEELREAELIQAEINESKKRYDELQSIDFFFSGDGNLKEEIKNVGFKVDSLSDKVKANRSRLKDIIDPRDRSGLNDSIDSDTAELSKLKETLKALESGKEANDKALNKVRKEVAKLTKEFSELKVSSVDEGRLSGGFKIVGNAKRYRVLLPVAGIPKNVRLQSSFDETTGALKVQIMGEYGSRLPMNEFSENIRIQPEGIGDFRNEIQTGDNLIVIEELPPITSIVGDDRIIEYRYRVQDEDGNEFVYHSEIPPETKTVGVTMGVDRNVPTKKKRVIVGYDPSIYRKISGLSNVPPAYLKQANKLKFAKNTESIIDDEWMENPETKVLYKLFQSIQIPGSFKVMSEGKPIFGEIDENEIQQRLREDMEEVWSQKRAGSKEFQELARKFAESELWAGKLDMVNEIAMAYLPVTKKYFKAIQAGEAAPPASISYKEENVATSAEVFTRRGFIDIKNLVNDPNVGLSNEQRKLFNTLVESLGRRASEALENLTVHIYKGNNGYNISGTFFDAATTASILAGAKDSDNITHEIAHSLEKFLDPETRGRIRTERVKLIQELSQRLASASTDTDLAAREILGKIMAAGTEGISSSQFTALVDAAVVDSSVNPQDLVDLLYPVTNSSEFFAAGMAGKIRSRAVDKSKSKVLRVLQAIIDAVKKLFGKRDIFDDVLSKIKTGKVDFDLDKGLLFQEKMKESRKSLENITLRTAKSALQAKTIKGSVEAGIDGVIRAREDFRANEASDIFSINQPTVSFLVSGLKKSVTGADEFLNDDGTIKDFKRIDSGTRLSDRDKARKETHRKLKRVAKKTSLDYFRDITQSVEGLAANKETVMNRISRFIASGHPEIADAFTLDSLDHYIKYRNRLEDIVSGYKNQLDKFNSDSFRKEMEQLGEARLKLRDVQNVAVQASEVIADSIDGLLESSRIQGLSEGSARALNNLSSRYQSILKNSGTIAVRVNQFAQKLNGDPYFAQDHFFGQNTSQRQMVRDMMRILKDDVKDDTDRVAVNLLAFHEGIRESAITTAFANESNLDRLKDDFKRVGNDVAEMIGRKVKPSEISRMVNDLINKGGALGEAAYIYRSKLRKKISFLTDLGDLEASAEAAQGILESEEFNSMVSGLQKRVNQKIQPYTKAGDEFIDLRGPETFGKSIYIPVPAIDDPTGKPKSTVILTAYSHESSKSITQNWKRKVEEYGTARSRINQWLKKNPNSMYASYYQDKLDQLDYLLSDAIRRPSAKTTANPFTLGIPNISMQNMTARSAKIAKNAFKNFERAALFISRSVMQYKSRTINGYNMAAQDRYPDLSPGEAREIYEEEVWKELSASYQGNGTPLQEGDKLRNGKIVTAKDIQALRIQQNLEASVVSALNSDSQANRPFLNKKRGVGTTGGILVEDYNPSSKDKTKNYRRIVETHKGMLHRRFDHDSIKFAEDLMNEFNRAKFGTKTETNEIDEVELDILLSEAYEKNFLLSFVNDRDKNYAPNIGKDLSNPDNLEAYYPEFAALVKNGGKVNSFFDLVSFIGARKGIEEKDAKVYLLRDIYRAIAPVASEISRTRTKIIDGSDDSVEVKPTNLEVTQVMAFSSFSQSRKNKVAPDYFYRHGFTNDGDFYTYANSAPSYFYNEMIESLDFAIDDYEKALGELNSALDNEKDKAQGKKKAKQLLKDYIALSRDEQNAGVYHRVDKLKRHLAELVRIRDGMVRINGGKGTDTSLPLEMPLLTELRNFRVGKVVSSVMTMTRPLFEPIVIQYKKMRQTTGFFEAASITAASMKGPLVNLALNTVKGGGILKAIPEFKNGLTDFFKDWDARRGLGGMFYNMVEAVLNETIDAEMMKMNNLRQPIDVVADLRAYKYNDLATLGKAIDNPTEEMPWIQKAIYLGFASPLFAIDQVWQKPVLDAALPRLGDEVGNYIAMNMGMRLVNKVDQRMRILFSHMEDTGIPFDLNDPDNPNNNDILDHDMFYGSASWIRDKARMFDDLRALLADGGVPGLGVVAANFFSKLKAARENGTPTEDIRLFTPEQMYSIAAEFPTALNIPTEGNRMIAARKNKVMESMMTLLGYPMAFLNNLASEFGEQNLKKNKDYKLGRTISYTGAALATSAAAIASVVAAGGFAETLVQSWGDLWDEFVGGEKETSPNTIKLIAQGREKEAAVNYLKTSIEIIPLIGPGVVGRFMSDTPIRPEFQPFKLLVSSAGSLSDYVAGAWNTKDPTYRLDIPIEMAFGPLAKPISSRLLQPGFEENLNMRRLITVNAPDDLRRAPNFGPARTSNYSRATPYGSKIMDAVLSGDKARARNLMNEAIEVVAEEQGISTSKAREKVESQINYMNPWGRLKSSPTLAQRKEILETMTDADREYFLDAEKEMVDGLRSIGVDMRLYRQGRGSSGYSSAFGNGFSGGFGRGFGSGFKQNKKSARSGAAIILGASESSQGRRRLGSSGSRLILGI